MNKQSLYVFGGALMATTALATASQAAIIKPLNDRAAIPTTSTITAKPLAIEVFSPTAATANAVTVGQTLTNNTANSILVDFSASIISPFQVQLNVTNAAFTGTPTVAFYGQSTTGSLLGGVGVTGCSVQTLSDKILITGCQPGATGLSTSRADAMVVMGITYISAGALATAGQSIKLDGVVSNATGSTAYETITSAATVTSKSAAQVAIGGSNSISVDNNATPAFSKFVAGASATAALGTITFSVTSAVGTDLSNVFGTAASVTGDSEVKISASALSDTSLVSVSLSTLAGAGKSPGTFVSGTVSFQVPAASLNNTVISVTFDGTNGISASSGTATATVTPTAVAGIVRAVTPFSGNLASYTRGGLSVELNGLFATAGQGSTLYRSVLRIANTSAIDGTATLTVRNDSTGAAIGSFTTTVTSGATRQIMSSDIEAAISTAAAAGAGYKVVVSGSFNGYVQHLLWNSVTGLFTDLSGFRNGALTVDP